MADPEIDAEQLAALIDGRLSPERRRALLAQIAASEEWTSIYADAVAASSPDTGATLSSRPVAPPARWFARPRTRQILTMAASVTVVGGLSLWWAARNRSQHPVGQVVAQLSAPDAGLAPGWNERSWSVVRGAVVPLTPTARSARLGALSVDLELALRSGNAAFVSLAGEIAALLQDVPGSAPAVLLYEEIARSPNASRDSLRGMHEQALRSATTLLDPQYLELGAWAEAALIAAARNDADFFRASPPGVEAFSIDVRGDVERIRERALGTPVDWGPLATAVRELLAAVAG